MNAVVGKALPFPDPDLLKHFIVNGEVTILASPDATLI